jgi:hypothetical protein
MTHKVTIEWQRHSPSTVDKSTESPTANDFQRLPYITKSHCVITIAVHTGDPITGVLQPSARYNARLETLVPIDARPRRLRTAECFVCLVVLKEATTVILASNFGWEVQSSLSVSSSRPTRQSNSSFLFRRFPTLKEKYAYSLILLHPDTLHKIAHFRLWLVAGSRILPVLVPHHLDQQLTTPLCSRTGMWRSSQAHPPLTPFE